MRISDWSSDVCSSDLLIAERLRFLIFVEDLGRGDAEALAGDEFGNEEMIVGVEPFGHLHRRRVGGMGAAGMGMAGLRAAGHGEIEVGADRLAAPVIAGRDGADQGGGVEDMVVEREVENGRGRDWDT